MDFKTQTNQQPQTQSAPAPAPRVANNASNGSGNRKIFAIIISAIVAVALIAGLALLWQMKDNTTSTSTGVETDKYQALFMTNGQVYFGHLSNLDAGYAQLTDVYYLQVQQAVQPAADKKDATEQPKVSLTKLGNELHGPTDKMHISRDQILFWENLKDDSTVVKAIKDYTNKQ